MKPARLPFALLLFFSNATVPAVEPPATTHSSTDSTISRVHSGLLVLYDFAETSQPTVRDRAAHGRPLDLHIDDRGAIRRSEGELEVVRDARMQSDRSARKITTVAKRTGEISIEAWIRPTQTDQRGPARIISLSAGATQRNVTLGQDGNRFDLRIRTTATNRNGIPSLSTPAGTVSRRMTHVVATHRRDGESAIFIDGQLSERRKTSGQLADWDDSYHLTLANELQDQRPWLGSYCLVAIYGRALSTDEIAQNYQAGPFHQDNAKDEANDRLAKISHFENHVAPLLAHHCLECHDAATREGGLDLAHKQPALAGGDSGLSITPGNPDDSLLWELVANDDMPLDRPHLSDDEKRVMKQWIQDGAIWSIDHVDPVIYVHSGDHASEWVRRLTVEEYIQTVRDALGVDIAREARKILPADLRADGFSNTAYNLAVDLDHVAAYSQLAETIVQRMDIAAFAGRFSQKRKVNDNDMRKLISEMGKHLLRGPLNEFEVNAYRGISTTVVSAGGSFDDAVAHIIQSMLQAPRFLYRIENQRGDGSVWPVDNYELASRVSYVVWGAPPDALLLKAAEAGRLDDVELRRQVDRMIDDPRAVSRSKQFASEWLNLNRLPNLQPSAERFPDWDSNLGAAMQHETLRYFEEIVWNRSARMSELLNSKVTFLTAELAEHYGLDFSAEGETDAYGAARYDLPADSPRGGILTQGSVLTVGGDDASMVSRGLFVFHDLLRGVVKDPPPCVDTTPVPSKPGLTQRGIAEDRIANANCGGCHGKFEPLAFGLERFDGLGTYRPLDEHGNSLREDGQILFPGDAEPVDYQTSNELMDHLAASDRVRQSITWKLTQFAIGRPLTARDAATMQKIHAEAEQGGGTYRSLIRAIILSDLVGTTRTERENDE